MHYTIARFGQLTVAFRAHRYDFNNRRTDVEILKQLEKAELIDMLVSRIGAADAAARLRSRFSVWVHAPSGQGGCTHSADARPPQHDHPDRVGRRVCARAPAAPSAQVPVGRAEDRAVLAEASGTAAAMIAPEPAWRCSNARPQATEAGVRKVRLIYHSQLAIDHLS